MRNNGEIVIRVDRKHYRPAEVESLIGDPKLARIKLNWVPKISLEELVKEMLDHDMNEALKERKKMPDSQINSKE